MFSKATKADKAQELSAPAGAKTPKAASLIGQDLVIGLHPFRQQLETD